MGRTSTKEYLKATQAELASTTAERDLLLAEAAQYQKLLAEAGDPNNMHDAFRRQIGVSYAQDLTTEDLHFLCNVARELHRARLKFPSSAHSLTALMEEVGELAKACLDEGRPAVFKEATQVAVMALRVAIEGDASFKTYRQKQKLAPLGPRALVGGLDEPSKQTA